MNEVVSFCGKENNDIRLMLQENENLKLRCGQTIKLGFPLQQLRTMVDSFLCSKDSVRLQELWIVIEALRIRAERLLWVHTSEESSPSLLSFDFHVEVDNQAILHSRF